MANDRKDVSDDQKHQTSTQGLNAGDLGIYSPPAAHSTEQHHDNSYDTYGFLRAMAQTYTLALAGGRKAENGSLLLGAGAGLTNAFIDDVLFRNTERKAPGYIADGVTLALAFTPQPAYLKAPEMVAVHTAGRLLDKLL